MCTLRIVGDARSTRWIDGEREDDFDLNILDGVECQDDFVEYLTAPYSHKLVSGYMSFELINGVLYTVTTYTCQGVLTEEEINELMEYTQGQWSDGIGEGFEQRPCRVKGSYEYYINPWHRNQKLTYYRG